MEKYLIFNRKTGMSKILTGSKSNMLVNVGDDEEYELISGDESNVSYKITEKNVTKQLKIVRLDNSVFANLELETTCHVDGKLVDINPKNGRIQILFGYEATNYTIKFKTPYIKEIYVFHVAGGIHVEPSGDPFIIVDKSPQYKREVEYPCDHKMIIALYRSFGSDLTGEALDFQKKILEIEEKYPIL